MPLRRQTFHPVKTDPILACMGSVRAIAVPQGSLLARFGGAEDYRDAFCREVEGAVSLEQFIARFYASAAFRPELLLLGVIGRGASTAEIGALARGVSDRLAVWRVVERTDTPSSSGAVGQKRSEILLHSKDSGTASWLAVEPSQSGTRLLFGSWVGKVGQSGWRHMLRPHRLYSRVLLAGC